MTTRSAKPTSLMTQATRLRLEAQLADPNICDRENPVFAFALAGDDLLLAIVHGLVDKNELARKELAGRGLDQNGIWVGFPAARKLHGLEG